MVLSLLFSILHQTAVYFSEHEFLFPFQIISLGSITRHGVFDSQGDTFGK